MTEGGQVLLASRGQRSGMLPNVLQHTGHPTTKNDLAPNVNRVKTEKSQTKHMSNTHVDIYGNTILVLIFYGPSKRKNFLLFSPSELWNNKWYNCMQIY